MFTGFWTKALEEFPLPNGVGPRPAHEKPNARYRITLNSEKVNTNISLISLDCFLDASINAEKERDDETEIRTAKSYSERNPFLARLASNTRQTSADHFQDTRLVEFDVSTSGDGLAYEPGDVCMVMPENSKENVDDFFELFSSLKREDRMRLEKADSFELPAPSQLPQVQSLKGLN